MTESPMRRARFLVIEALYEADTSGHDAESVLARLLGEAVREGDAAVGEPGPAGFARGAIRGVQRRRPEIDRFIEAAASLYPLETMAVVDRNILRLAIWELLTDDAAPVGAVVNEAVELAHRYGGESSPRFVNGVLRTISQRIRGEVARTASRGAPPSLSSEQEI
jgi:N utilization substance protein B